MSQEEILSALAEIVYEITRVPESSVTPDKAFSDDLDIDSLSMVEIIVAAEEKFGVTIPDDDAKKLKTVGDAIDYIKRVGVAA